MTTNARNFFLRNDNGLEKNDLDKKEKTQFENNKQGNLIYTNDSMELIPKVATINPFQFDFDEFGIASVQYEEGPCGCTLILFDRGAQAYADRRGGSIASMDVFSNNDENSLDGICIAGGSILGLEATCGVIAESLKDNNYKHFLSIGGSMLRSHNMNKNKIYPDKALGRFAYNSLKKGIVNLGQCGAALTASVGQGAAFYKYKNGIKIFCLVAVNAIGDIYDKGKIIKKSGFDETWNDDNYKYQPPLKKHHNTTISVLITNLELSSYFLEQLGKQVHTSMSATISPFHTIFDGDVFYCCSTKSHKMKISDDKFLKFSIKCSEIMRQAILSSIPK